MHLHFLKVINLIFINKNNKSMPINNIHYRLAKLKMEHEPLYN